MNAKYRDSERGTMRPHWSMDGIRIVTDGFSDDPLLSDLARLLINPRLSDAYAESIRAQLREITYQARLVLGEAA